MKVKAKYWNGVISGMILPLYAFVLLCMGVAKDSNVTAVAVVGGIFILPGLISSTIWASNFYQRYLREEVDIKNYKLPLILTGINIILFAFSIFIYLPIF
jgi:hypothetical protein